MTIREQLEILYGLQVEFVVVGGQAGVLRQAVEFSHDLDILVNPTRENAERLREAVRAITGVETDVETLCGRDFQQYIRPEDGAEIDVHLKPDHAATAASGPPPRLCTRSVRRSPGEPSLASGRCDPARRRPRGESEDRWSSGTIRCTAGQASARSPTGRVSDARACGSLLSRAF